MKKVLLYCHDTLGFGHISRMLNLYYVLEKKYSVHIVFGGKVPKDHLKNIIFSSLDCTLDGKLVDFSFLSSETKKLRISKLSTLLEDFRPDIVMIDYYPFGRLNLHTEIDTLIKTSKNISGTKVYSIMRDIFVGKKCFSREDFQDFSTLLEQHFSMHFQQCIEKNIQEFYNFCMWKKVEKSLLSQMLLEYYFDQNLLDGVIVFGDKKLYQIESEFFLPENITSKFYYMGYLLPQRYTREKSQQGQYVLLSFGGSVFHTKNYLRLLKILSKLNYPVKCMVPFFKKEEYQKICMYFQEFSHIEFVDFSGDFSSLISEARLYICAGGYGSMMDIMYYQVPSLIALNFNSDIAINETEDGKRFEILTERLPLYFFDDKTKIRDIVRMLESNGRDFDFSRVNTSGTENIQNFFTDL